jgi:hypothetical protein
MIFQNVRSTYYELSSSRGRKAPCMTQNQCRSSDGFPQRNHWPSGMGESDVDDQHGR